MAEYTNVSVRPITLPDGTMMVPGQVTEVSDECSGNQGFKDLMEAGDIVSGKPPAEGEQKAEPAQVTVQRTTTVTATPQTQQPAPQPQPQTKA